MRSQTMLEKAMDCEFTEAYLKCALWSGTESDEQGQNCVPLDDNYGTDDMDTECLRSAMTDCAAFMIAHWEDIAHDLGRAGHDFWLTRNHHGAGFWDGDWPHDVGQKLTEAAHVYGSVDLYVGDDGKIYGG